MHSRNCLRVVIDKINYPINNPGLYTAAWMPDEGNREIDFLIILKNTQMPSSLEIEIVIFLPDEISRRLMSLQMRSMFCHSIIAN